MIEELYVATQCEEKHNDLEQRTARIKLFNKLRPYELDQVDREIRELDLHLRAEVTHFFRSEPDAVETPDHWCEEQTEAFFALQGRKKLIEQPDGPTPPVGRLVRVPIKRPFSPDESIRTQIIAEVAAEASERFGREITPSAVEQAWKRYRKDLVTD